jgi:hypothetical protein
MTGGIGTIMDNTSREGTNRSQLQRIKDFQKRILNANYPKISYKKPKQFELSDKEIEQNLLIIKQIRSQARNANVKNLKISIFVGIIFIVLIILFFVFMT